MPWRPEISADPFAFYTCVSLPTSGPGLSAPLHRSDCTELPEPCAISIVAAAATARASAVQARVDAGYVFDGMPPKKRRGGNRQGYSPAVAGGEGDRLGALPDDILHHVLSFIPAEEGVRTCVLSRRWRHLWKSATSLLIVRRDWECPEAVNRIREFVDHLLLLRGFSRILCFSKFIFRRNLKWSPIFGRLKSLLLNEYWCVPADFRALAYMLEHSPILEKLTLQLYCKGPKSKVEMKAILDPTERSAAISEHLKIVETKCEVIDDKVLDVLKFLSKLGIYTYRFIF